MNLGNKIMTLRKKNNLSQEVLAEKVGVTRQTISKWELEETTPDINQAKKLSMIFNISLDELVNNDVNSILIEKVSNTERLAGIIIKILKVSGILLILFIVLMLTLLIMFSFKRFNNDRVIVGKASVSCKLNSEEYLYEVEYNKNYQVINAGGDAFIPNHIDVEKYEDINQIIAHIEDYFSEHNGSCEVNYSK